MMPDSYTSVPKLDFGVQMSWNVPNWSQINFFFQTLGSAFCYTVIVPIQQRHMKVVVCMRVGAALALATLLAFFGIGLNSDAKSGNRKVSAAVHSNHPNAPQPKSATKSVFSVDGVPVVIDEDTVVWAA